MKKSKFKIKISNEFIKLINFFNNEYKKFVKFIKFKIIKHSTNYFIDKFKKLKNIKLFKISNLSISLIFFITLLFLYLFYLSVPTLYNKQALQKNITNKLIKEFKINFSLSSNMRYFILPSPHFVVENVKIFNDDLKDPKELSQIKKLKIYLSQKNLFDQNNLKIEKILIEEANFIVKKEHYGFFNKYLKKQLSEKKTIIKNSNFFLKGKNNNTISIFPIKNINLFYNKEKLVNELIAKGKFFKIPFYLKWNFKFGGEPQSTTLIKLKKLDLEIRNDSFFEDKKYLSNNNIFFRNAKLNSNFQIENNLINFNSKDSKIVNNNLKYKGKAYLDPFDLALEIDIEKLDLIKFLTSGFAFIKAANLEFLLNKNLNAKINIDVKKVRNKMFDYSKILINFNNGEINFNDSYLISEKIGSIKLNRSKIDIVDGKLIFNGSFSFSIIDQDKFYTSFQIPKKNRKLLKNIFFDININSFDNKLNIGNFRINNKKNILNDETQSIINQYNNNKKNKIQNWINLKNFTREIFNSYSG